MYTYNCQLMEWSGAGEGSYATIGYNLNGNYENHLLSGTSLAKEIACLINEESNPTVRRRQAVGWHNRLYQLPTALDPIQQLRAECLTLEILDIQAHGSILSAARSLGVCPPSLLQALLDFRFTFNKDTSTTNSQCYNHIFSAGNTGTSSLVCCYAPQSSSAPGSLLVGGIYGSSIALYHPVHYSESYKAFDKDLRSKCCASGFCHIFHGRRPIDNSINYIPPFFGFGNGDPHITTLDRTTYTFNGRGEYTLVEYLATGFVLQGRTEPISDTSNATQFSAFAMGIRDESLSAEVRLFRGRLVSFVNGEDVSSDIESINATTGDNSTFFLTRVGENSIRVLFHWEKLAYIITVTQREDILDFVINLDKSLEGQSRGLFGNFNGDGTDDFIMPNGVTVPSDASDQMLHDYGKSWQIVEQESLFTYPTGMNFSNFTFPDHIAPLLSDVVASASDSVVSDCNGNEQCIFDAIETGNTGIGTETLNSINSNNEDVMTANNFPPTLDGPSTFRVTVGSSSAYVFTAIDPNDEPVDVTVMGPATPDVYSLISNGNSYTFTLTVEGTIEYEIMFVGADSLSATSTLSPLVEICACENGGTCTLDGVVGIDTNVIDMLCECPPGWDGRYCENDQDGCSALTCFEGVQCYDIPAPESGAICGACPLGYEGDGEKCVDVDECNSTEGSSVCQHTCINIPGSFMCGCREGFELSGTTNCIDINECQLELDGCQQECTNRQGSFGCSCRTGFELGDDGTTCNALEPCSAGALTCTNGQCVVINNAPTCSCNNGYTSGSNNQCLDVDECRNDVCGEGNCRNTAGSFVCSCNDGYTLGANQRSCEDINECYQIDSPLCGEKEVCQNTAGSYECACPAGTVRSNGECEDVEIPPPPVVVIPTQKPLTDDKLGRANSVNVTHRLSKEDFDMTEQFKFKIEVVYEVTKYCAEKPTDCGGVVEITSSDVIILDEIASDANGRATFLMFVYTKSPTDVLSGKILQVIVSSMLSVVTVAPVVGEGEGSSGLSGGEVAAIIIVVLVVLVVVLIATVVILLRVKVVPKPRIISNLSMDIFRPRNRSSMLIEEGGYDAESMRDTTSVGGDVAEAKAKEAVAEAAVKKGEGKAKEPGDEEKVDLVKEAEAEETV